MRAFDFGRCALISVLVGLLSACGGGSSVPVAADSTFNGATGPKHHQTFSYTGAKQTFIVPAGVTRLTVIARGGEGSGAFYHGAGTPGFPGRVYAVIRVHSGDKLDVFVAGSGAAGGFNGGGAGGGARGAGGGASDVRMGGDTLKDRIIVAAGGGTAGGCDLYCYADGGDGGGLTGDPGSCDNASCGGGGGGGTQSAGGSGGAGGIGQKSGENGQPGGNGSFGKGGNGGAGGPGSYQNGIPGGGGGGGYYGGGGGGGSPGGSSGSGSYYFLGSGGGGGGSSYVEPSAITSRMWTGWLGGKGDGQVIFSW